MCYRNKCFLVTRRVRGYTGRHRAAQFETEAALFPERRIYWQKEFANRKTVNYQIMYWRIQCKLANYCKLVNFSKLVTTRLCNDSSVTILRSRSAPNLVRRSDYRLANFRKIKLNLYTNYLNSFFNRIARNCSIYLNTLTII